MRFATLLAFCLAGCEAAGTVEPPDAEPRFGSSGPVLVECPTDVPTDTTGTIDAAGGVLRLANHSLSLPALAVLVPTEFRLAAPAGQYMELNIKAGGQESFGFEKTVSITLDYSRCTRSNIDKAALTVWKIDPSTKALLKRMPDAVDNKTARTITFPSDSLSSWAIAE